MKPDSAKERIRVVAAVIEKNGRYLLTQRTETAVLPLLWEFPGGRVEQGETDADALVREIEYRLDVCIEPGDLISLTSHEYANYWIDLFLYECTLCNENVCARRVNDARWVASDEFEKYSFTPADEASMNRLLAEKHEI